MSNPEDVVITEEELDTLITCVRADDEQFRTPTQQVILERLYALLAAKRAKGEIVSDEKDIKDVLPPDVTSKSPADKFREHVAKCPPVKYGGSLISTILAGVMWSVGQAMHENGREQAEIMHLIAETLYNLDHSDGTGTPGDLIVRARYLDDARAVLQALLNRANETLDKEAEKAAPLNKARNAVLIAVEDYNLATMVYGSMGEVPSHYADIARTAIAHYKSLQAQADES
jgi:hypothetical protein